MQELNEFEQRVARGLMLRLGLASAGWERNFYGSRYHAAINLAISELVMAAPEISSSAGWDELADRAAKRASYYVHPVGDPSRRGARRSKIVAGPERLAAATARTSARYQRLIWSSKSRETWTNLAADWEARALRELKAGRREFEIREEIDARARRAALRCALRDLIAVAKLAWLAERIWSRFGGG